MYRSKRCKHIFRTAARLYFVTFVALLFLNVSLPVTVHAQTHVWQNTWSLDTARNYHTATLLIDGKVLVTGGRDDWGNYYSSSELYDPRSFSGWSYTTGELHTARALHTATIFPNGKVLVAGGFNGGPACLSSSELYDPTSETWQTTGSLHNGRDLHTATIFPNGKVLVAGGIDYGSHDLSSSEVYDLASGTWQNTGNLHAARDSHTATLLPNGKVLVVGGLQSGGSSWVYLSSSELYDPASGTWQNTGSLHAARVDHTATLLPNGKVLVAGGTNSAGALSSSELYDPASGTWQNTGSLHAARDSHTATLLPNGKVLVAGGCVGSVDLSSSELYDPTSENWSSTGNLHTARDSHTATCLYNGKVLVAGGYYKGAGLSTCELYITQEISLAANFSTEGLWLYQSEAWKQLNGGAMDLASCGNKLFANTVYGLFEYDGVWNLVTYVNPDGMLCISGKLYMYAYKHGLWKYDGGWTPLAPIEPDMIAANGTNLLATFSGYGLFQYDGATWTQLSPYWNVENMLGISGKVYVDVGTLGLWKYDGGWTCISPVNPNKIQAYNGKLVANFPGYGLFEYDGSNWISWLTPYDGAKDLIGVSSNLYADSADVGLWKYDGSTWTPIASIAPNRLGSYGEKLVASFAGIGLGEYDGAKWTFLAPASDVTDMVGVDLP